jgi:alkanesulfonate monooxygenase SsuD/methylene tetrahydromethanopterin reductase-like flavin-dependent oxidoreductase (luciferase family)
LLAMLGVSIDAMCGGRLDVGIGAGWSTHEFRGYGYPFPPAGERLDMLEEAAQVLIAMWTQDEARFVGEHYVLGGAITRPKSLQDPYPPLWIAGGGERRTLRLVAEYGDYSNVSGDIDTFRHKSRVLAGHCDDVGRDYSEIGRSVHLMSVIGRDEADLAAKLEIAAERRNCSPDEFAAEHLAVTVDQAVEVLGEFRDEGCSDMILYFYDMGRNDSLELFASEVMPALRSA